MSHPTITVEARDLNVEARMIRMKNKIPLVLYGHNKETQHLEISYELFRKVFEKAGMSTIIDVELPGGKKEKVLVHEIQLDPVKDRIIHVDLYAVKMTEKITTHIPLVFAGESPAVKALGGIFVTAVDELEVRCLPSDLVHEITVNISGLENFGDSIHLRDITIPHGMEIVDRDDEMTIANVQAPKIEEAEEPLPSEAEQQAVADAQAASGAAQEEEKKAD